MFDFLVLRSIGLSYGGYRFSVSAAVRSSMFSGCFEQKGELVGEHILKPDIQGDVVPFVGVDSGDVGAIDGAGRTRGYRVGAGVQTRDWSRIPGKKQQMYSFPRTQYSSYRGTFAPKVA